MRIQQEFYRTKLHAYLARRGITQGQFADELGMNRVHVNGLLTGSRRLTSDFMGAFLFRYGLSEWHAAFGMIVLDDEADA